MPMPDSSALIDSADLSGRPFLGSPVVVDQILRHALHDVIECRKVDGDVVGLVKSKCNELQEIFLGRSNDYHASFWNRETSLGAALVNRSDIGGDTSDAVLRLFVRFFRLFIEDMVSFEQDRISEDDFQKEVDALLRKYTHILIGSGDA